MIKRIKNKITININFKNYVLVKFFFILRKNIINFQQQKIVHLKLLIFSLSFHFFLYYQEYKKINNCINSDRSHNLVELNTKKKSLFFLF